MWSDPAGLEDVFCLFWCTDTGLERLAELLDDPANDARPLIELYADAGHYQLDRTCTPGSRLRPWQRWDATRPTIPAFSNACRGPSHARSSRRINCR